MKNTIENKKEENEKKWFFSNVTKEFREVFSDRINVIIIAGSFLIGWASIGGIIFYESQKVSKQQIKEDKENINSSESLQIRLQHEEILNTSPQSIQILEESKESSGEEQVPNNETITNKPKKERKEILREEILTTWKATIGNNPDDIKNLIDLINEHFNDVKK